MHIIYELRGQGAEQVKYGARKTCAAFKVQAGITYTHRMTLSDACSSAYRMHVAVAAPANGNWNDALFGIMSATCTHALCPMQHVACSALGGALACLAMWYTRMWIKMWLEILSTERQIANNVLHLECIK